MNAVRIIGPFIKDGKPASMAIPVNTLADLYAAGQIGSSFDTGARTWTIVLVEPAVSAVAVGDVMYWKDNGNTGGTPTVTNVLANALGGAAGAVTQVAGVSQVAFSSTGTLGSLICIATGASKGVTVKIDSTAVIVGSPLTASAASAATLALVTTQVTPQVGVARTAKAGSPATSVVDLNLPVLP